MNTIEQAQEMSKRLSQGAAIARDRRIDHDFAVLAAAASITIDALIADLAALKNQEPVAWVGDISEGSQLLLDRPKRWEAMPLYLAAGAQAK